MGDMVGINTDSIELLIKIFKKDKLDENLYKAFMGTKGVREFLSHEKIMGRPVSIRDFKGEIKRAVENSDYEDGYGFYVFKNNLGRIEEDIKDIKRSVNPIIKEAKRKVYKVVPKSMPISTDIKLYWGGMDGGFTLKRREIYINYRRYFGNREEFIKILSHEMYHARKISIKNRGKFLLGTILKENRLLYKTVGRIVEEGLALIVQHGPDLKKDDITETLTKSNLVLVREEFNILNDVLWDIKAGEGSVKVKYLNIYVIGYFIISLIYKERGIGSLNYWTVDLNYRRIIKEYVEICNKKGISPNIEGAIIRWILKERGI